MLDKDFLVRHHLQSGSGPYAASYPLRTVGSSPALKWPGRQTDRLSSSFEVKIV